MRCVVAFFSPLRTQTVGELVTGYVSFFPSFYISFISFSYESLQIYVRNISQSFHFYERFINNCENWFFIPYDFTILIPILIYDQVKVFVIVLDDVIVLRFASLSFVYNLYLYIPWRCLMYHNKSKPTRAVEKYIFCKVISDITNFFTACIYI